MIPYGKQSINHNDIKSVTATLKSNYLTTGPKVEEFEKEFALKTGFSYAVAVSSGTSALHLASSVLIKKDDFVLTTPNSFLATSNSLLYVGAKPLFVDITKNGIIDLNLAETKLKQNRDIKALYAVSYSGVPFDDLSYLKKRYNIKILVDNAHYIGKEKSNCDIATYSFHPIKHITTFEGGMITTNDKKIYEKLLLLRNHGMKKTSKYPWDYEMVELGYNYRLSDVACSLGVSQLKRVDEFLKKRANIANYYHRNLPSFIKPLYEFNKDSAYHLFVVRYPFKNLDEKANLFNKMKEKGIILQYHYIPIFTQPFYSYLKIKLNDFPVMKKHYLEAFSLPIYAELTKKEQDFVIDSLKELLS